METKYQALGQHSRKLALQTLTWVGVSGLRMSEGVHIEISSYQPPGTLLSGRLKSCKVLIRPSSAAAAVPSTAQMSQSLNAFLVRSFLVA